MKIHLSIYLTLFSLLLFQNVNAQNDEVKPTKVKKIIINGAPKTAGVVDESTSKVSYLLKVSPFSLFKGEFPIHFEKSISKKVSFEISPFITTKEHSLNSLLTNFVDPFYYPFEYIQDQENVHFLNTKLKGGFGIRGEIRIYPDKVFDGFYFGFASSTKKHNILTDVEEKYTKTALYTNQNHSYYSTDIRFTFGNQTTLGDADNVFIEWAFGAGSRKYKAKEYPIYSYDNINYDVTYKNLELRKISMFANIKLGFTF